MKVFLEKNKLLFSVAESRDYFDVDLKENKFGKIKTKEYRFGCSYRPTRDWVYGYRLQVFGWIIGAVQRD